MKKIVKLVVLMLVVTMISALFALPSAYADDPVYLVNEQFEWGEESEYTTYQVKDIDGNDIAGRTLVYKSGTAIPGLAGNRYAADFYEETTSNTANFAKFTLKTSIVEDEDTERGQVLKFETRSNSWSGRRGISFLRNTITGTNAQFGLFSFDFKFDEDTLLAQSGVFVNVGNVHIDIRSDSMRFLSLTKMVHGLEELAGPSISGYISEISDTNTLKADEWYNVKLLYDTVNNQFDVLINDVMVAQDVDAGLSESTSSNWVDTSAETKTIKKVDYKTYYPIIGMLYAYGDAGTLKAFYLDNVQSYELTDAEALEIAMEGVDNFIGDPVYSGARLAGKFSSATKTMKLPFSGLTGYSYYASSTNKALDNGLHTPYMSYNWSVPSDSGSDFSVNRTTFNWGTGDLPAYTFTISGTTATLNKNFTYTTAAQVRSNLGVSDIVYDSTNSLPFTGDVADISFPLSVVITKGTETDTLNWDIALERPLLESPVEGLDIGVPFSSTYARSSDGLREFRFGTIVENNSGSACTYMPIIAVYDTSGNLIKTNVLSVTLEDGETTPESLVKRYVALSAAEEAAAAYAKCFLWFGGSYQPVTEVIPLSWK
jgi:hypothetical protein